MGIVLTLAILAGLLMTAVPVAAGDVTFSNVSVPNVTNNQLVIGQGITAIDVAPDGKNMFAWLTPSNKLYKSTDAGVTWTTSGIGTGMPAVVVTQIKISPNYAADSNLIATDGTSLFRSTDMGANWYVATQTIPATITDAKISSIDISTYYNGGGVAILESFGGGTAGIDGGIGLLVTNQGNWTYFTTAGGGWAVSDVYAAAFSPNYQTDTEIIAVCSTAALTYVTAKMGANAWDADVAPVASVKYAAAAIAADVSNKVVLTFPSNYDSASGTNNKIFMGMYSAIGTLAGTSEIYRLKMALSGGLSTATPTAAGLGILSDLAYTGTATAGTVVASDATSIIYSTDAVNATSATWNSPTTSVNGTNAKLHYSGTTLYAATKGNFSAFFTSADANVFSAISLMNVSAAANVTFKQTRGVGGLATTWFTNIYDAAVVPNRFNRVLKSTDSGATWKGIFFYQNIGTESISTIGLTSAYATDNTIYYYTSSGGADLNGNKIYKSTDAGATWTKYSAPAGITQIQASSMILLDANTYWVASTGGNLYKVGSFTATDLNGAITNPVPGITPTWMVLKSTAGAFYFSGDAGVTFTKLGTGTEFSNTGTNTAAFNDIANKTIYAVQAGAFNNSPATNAVLMKWVVGTSSAWETVRVIQGTNSVGVVVPFSPDQIGVTAGILYATVRGGRDSTYTLPTASAVLLGGTEQIWRSVNLFSDPNNLTFEAIPGSLYATQGELARGPIWIAPSAGGNILTVNSADPGFVVNGYASDIQVLTDSVTAAPASVAPVASANIDPTVDFTWKPVTFSGAKYTVQIAYDSAFNNLVTTTPAGVALALGPTASTQLNAIPLAAGKTFYWRVQVSAGNPLASAFSAPVMFSTKLASDVNQGLNATDRLSPLNGAMVNTLTPAMTWGAVTNATSYEFKIATDAAFSSVVDSKTGLTTTAYSLGTPLKAGTTYFWEVRAISGANTGDWVVSAFTTAVAVPVAGSTTPPPPQTIVIPTPTFNIPTATVIIPSSTGTPVAPATPGYIWVIIVIGAVLVIAVVVLIVRTRRV